jgi:hypothetical protein
MNPRRKTSHASATQLPLTEQFLYEKSPAEAGLSLDSPHEELDYRLGAGAVLVGPGAGAPGATGPLVADGMLLLAVRPGPWPTEL